MVKTEKIASRFSNWLLKCTGKNVFNWKRNHNSCVKILTFIRPEKLYRLQWFNIEFHSSFSFFYVFKPDLTFAEHLRNIIDPKSIIKIFNFWHTWFLDRRYWKFSKNTSGIDIKPYNFRCTKIVSRLLLPIFTARSLRYRRKCSAFCYKHSINSCTSCSLHQRSTTSDPLKYPLKFKK